MKTEQDMSKKYNELKNAGSDIFRGQDELARHYHVSRRCVSEWQARRIIPYLKVGKRCVLFRKSDVDAALARYEVKAV